jgi:hypothetical protein
MENKQFDTLGLKKFSDSSDSRETMLINFCKEVVCRYYGKEASYLDTPSRKHEYVKVRQVCMYMIRNIFKVGYNRMVIDFKKDHATIIYSVKTIQGFLEYDKDLQKEINDLHKILKLKSNANINNIDLENDFYYIDMNNINSVKLTPQKSIIFAGFTQEEISRMNLIDTKDNFQWLNTPDNIKEHFNTALYILESKQPKDTENDN